VLEPEGIIVVFLYHARGSRRRGIFGIAQSYISQMVPVLEYVIQHALGVPHIALGSGEELQLTVLVLIASHIFDMVCFENDQAAIVWIIGYRFPLLGAVGVINVFNFLCI